jgi:hypothetical protein
MRNRIIELLKLKGQQPILESIDKSIKDFKRLGDSKAEIKELIRGFYFGLDNKIDNYIISIGY